MSITSITFDPAIASPTNNLGAKGLSQENALQKARDRIKGEIEDVRTGVTDLVFDDQSAAILLPLSATEEDWVGAETLRRVNDRINTGIAISNRILEAACHDVFKEVLRVLLEIKALGKQVEEPARHLKIA